MTAVKSVMITPDQFLLILIKLIFCFLCNLRQYHFCFFVFEYTILPIAIRPIAPSNPEPQANMVNPWTIRSKPAGSVIRVD